MSRLYRGDGSMNVGDFVHFSLEEFHPAGDGLIAPFFGYITKLDTQSARVSWRRGPDLRYTWIHRGEAYAAWLTHYGPIAKGVSDV